MPEAMADLHPGVTDAARRSQPSLELNFGEPYKTVALYLARNDASVD